MRDPLNIWKRKTLLFMTSQALSLFGSSLVSYAIFWRITLDTQSGLAMTLYMLFGFLPTFFLSPFAGVWADRYDRRRLIILGDGVIALATLVLAILFLQGYQQLWLLFVIPLVRALGQAVQTPAVNAFLPQLVPEDRLLKTNGLLSSMSSAIMLISPMVSGALLSFTSIEVILLIDIVTAIAAILVLLSLQVEPPIRTQAAEKPKYWQDLAAGIRYVRHHQYLGRFFVFITVMFFLVTPVALMTPLQVTRTFGEDIWRLTAIEVAFSGGMLAGGLLIAAWGGFRNRVQMMALSMLLIGLTTFLLGVVGNFWVYIVIMTITGITLPFYNTPATTLLQEKVDPDYLGRVFGVMGMIASGVMPLAMMAFGPLADIIKIEWLLIMTGIMLAALSSSLILNKVLLRAGEPAMAVESSSDVLPGCPPGQPDCAE
jgi:MFS transporter, DHA3 family, macrolide efflux protein